MRRGINVGHIALNCDEFAVVSSVERLLYASATMVKLVKLKTTGPFLTVGRITSLSWSDALTEQADVLVAKI